jgi:hypothetical protein
MAQAVKDQRCAEAAANAAAMFRVIWKQACDADSILDPPFWDRNNQIPSAKQRFIYAMDDPNFAGAAANNDQLAGFNPALVPNNMTQLTPIGTVQPSYPVYLDHIGWQANGIDPRRRWFVHPTTGAPLPQGGNNIGLIPRRPLYVPSPSSPNPLVPTWVRIGDDPTDINLLGSQRILRFFSLMDDITFNENGTPMAPVSVLERQGRYSWAYLVRRIRNDRASRFNVDVTIVVYSGRSIDVPANEENYYGQPLDSNGQPTFARTKMLRLLYGTPKPALRRGSWVLDATIFHADGSFSPQARFYRVVNVDDGPQVGANASLNLELQTDISPGPTQRVFFVLDNVAEVFPIGDVSRDSPPRLETTP